MSETIKKIINFGNISYRFILNNRKSTLTTLIGLIISLTIIISSTLLLESYRRQLISEILLPDRNNSSGEIHLDLHPDALGIGETAWIQNNTNYERKIIEIFEELKYRDYLVKQRWHRRFDIGYWNDSAYYGGLFNHFNFIDLYTLESFNFFEPYLISGSRFPQNYSEIIVVTKASGIQLKIDQELEISIPPGQAGPGRYGSINVTIVGIIEYEEVQSLFLEFFNPLSKEFCMLSYPHYAVDLIEYMKRNYMFVFVSHVIGKIFLDPFKIDIYDLPREKTKYGVLLTELANRFSTANIIVNLVDVYQLQSDMQVAENKVQILKILLFLIDLPVIAISFYLISYSFSLIKRQKIETIGTIKTRGASKEQIFIFLMVEVTISTIIALIFGLLSGTFLSEILLRSINFLDFSGARIPVVISQNIILNLTILSFIAIFTLNLSAIFRYSKMSIFESIQPIDQGVSFWKRYYLDIVSVIIGLAGYYIINEVGKITTNWEDNPLIPLVFLLLGVPAPLLLFIGLVLVIARIFPILIDKIAKILWIRRGMILAFALVNIVRHKQTATRTVILMTLALSYVIISASLAFSIDESKRLETNYSIGADMRLNAPYLNDSTLNLLENNVTGISSISMMVYGYIPSAHLLHYYTFCFVDTTKFAKTAFFNDRIFGVNKPLTSLMEKISDNKSILLYKPNFEGQPKLQINDTFTFSFANRTLEVLLNYTIVGSFNLWPQYYKYPWAPEDAYFVIGSLGMYNDLIEPELISLSSINYIIDLDDDSDIDSVIKKVRLYTGFVPISAKLEYQKYERSVERRFGLSILNSTLLSCVVVSVISSIMFTLFTFLERGKERGIERALGMSRLQTGILFIIEGLTVLFFGIIIGLTTGLINTTFFVFVTQLGRSIPPIIVAYPFDFISSYIFFIVLISGITTLLIAYQTTRRDISRVLKVE